MSREIDYLVDNCCGCGACAAICPKTCIEMVPDDLGFLRPVVDDGACVNCGACGAVCPSIKQKSEDECISVYWACAKNDSLLNHSSSGGVFGLLAKSILSEGGLVVGAAWVDHCHSVEHVAIERISDLDRVLRSKYVQSSIKRSLYKSVSAALRSERLVLFSGTACQISALKGFLGQAAMSPLLLCVEVICHGVPSPVLWDRWASYREDKVGAVLTSVNMRSKTTGWSSFSAAYEYAAEKDGVPVRDSSIFTDDWYMRAFLSNASLRACCFSCPSKRSCGSDITLGDFWGIEKQHPNVSNGQGASAVICNTVKGAEAFSRISAEVELGASTFDAVLDGNPALTRSVRPFEERGTFIRSVALHMPIDELMQRWSFRPSLLTRLKRKLLSLKDVLIKC